MHGFSKFESGKGTGVSITGSSRLRNGKPISRTALLFWEAVVSPKKRLHDKNPAYLRAFYRETCRAELTHWATILFAPLFFLWNPFWVGVFMIFYALAENIPLIMAQRYNRNRLRRILET